MPAADVRSAPLRVLLFSALIGHPWGGSEKYWFDAVRSPEVVKGLEMRIHITHSAASEERGKELRRLGHTVTWHESPRLSSAHRLGRAVLRRLGREPADVEHEQWVWQLGEHRPDLLVIALPSAVDYWSVETPTAVARSLGIPYWIIVQHSPEHFFPPSDQEADKFRTTFGNARRVIFIAQRNRRSVERVMGAPMPNAWMGVNSLSRGFLRTAGALAPSEDHALPSSPRLLNLARFEPDVKGQHLLLEALTAPEWREREWRLVLAGGGRHGATLGRLLGYYGLTERVEVLDHRDDVLEVIAGAHLAVMPSLSEGTPYGLLEVMAAGVPAVATPVGGIPEVVLDGRTGWLAAAPEMLQVADALERAWADRPNWPAFGRNAAALVAERHCAEEALPRLGAVLREDLRVSTNE